MTAAQRRRREGILRLRSTTHSLGGKSLSLPLALSAGNNSHPFFWFFADAWMRELKGRRERIMALDKMSLTCVYKPQSSRKSGGERFKSSLNSLPGSFRRLEVD